MARGILSLYEKKRVFILGAGFSAPLGMPLTADLLKGIYDVAKERPWYLDGALAKNGQAHWLVEQLQWYFPLAQITHKSVRSGKTPAGFDLENFLSYVAATSAFQYKTGERWNEHGDKFTAFLKSWLGEFIVARQIESKVTDTPPHYLQFASSLSDAVVLTFNWDTLLEQLLERVGMQYAFNLPSTFNKSKVPVIKLHGSVDWFSMNRAESKAQWMKFDKVGKTFKGVGRGRGDPRRYYRSHLTPWIVTPSFDKIFQVINLGDLWQVPWLWLQDKLEVIVIGFSMRPDDFHSRAFIYPQLVEGSRSGELSVKVVDLAHTNQQKAIIRDRFEGVKSCKFYFDGFDAGALEFITSTR